MQLIPEPKNPFDEHAIGVFSARRFQIGYVSSQRAVYLKKLLRDGHDVTAIFQDLAPWGAIARVGIDQSPTLPAVQDNTEEDDDIDRDPFVDFDPTDNVDVIWPDDPDPDLDASYLT